MSRRVIRQLPPRHDGVRTLLAVTIDTEEEGRWGGGYPQAGNTCKNIGWLRELDPLVATFGLKITYLVDYPVAADPAAMEILNDRLSRQEGEIGAHLHPWCTPPFEPGDNLIIDLLNGSDKYTLLAPTDDAFAALLGRLEPLIPGVSANPCILDDNDDLSMNTLFTVLAYHVIDGRRFSNSLFNAKDAKMVETLAGANITTYVDMDGTPLLHDVDGQEIGVVSSLININAVNGVIHVVDTVLLPIDLPDED